MASPQSQHDLTAWAMAKGFDLTKSYSGNELKPGEFDFHITVICSENEAYIEDSVRKIQPLTVDFTGFEVLGVDRKVPVLTTACTPQMQDHRDFFEDFYGLHDNWPTWKTHVSLSYNWFGLPDISTMELPNFSITLDRITVNPLI